MSAFVPLGRVVRLVAEPADESTPAVAAEVIEGGVGRLLPDREIDVDGLGTGFRSGDVLFGKLRPYLAKVWLADQRGRAIGDLHVYRPSAELEPAYLRYCLLSDAFISPVTSSTFGAKMPRASWDFIKTVPIYVPPLPEQRAIADYLDRETAKIDTLIVKQMTMIERLRERRAALLISLADAEQPRREMIQLRRILAKRRDLPQSGSPVVTAYRDGVVIDRALRREEGYTFSDQEAGYQRVRRGDLVFHALDGFAGATGLSQSDGQCSPVYHVCAVRGADPEYLALLLRAYGLSGRLTAYAWSVRQRSADYRNWALFASLYVPLPPLDEQRKIAGYLDRETVKIDTLIMKVERHIELAKERRAALIMAAVTGQIDVTTSTQSGDAA